MFRIDTMHSYNESGIKIVLVKFINNGNQTVDTHMDGLLNVDGWSREPCFAQTF